MLGTVLSQADSGVVCPISAAAVGGRINVEEWRRGQFEAEKSAVMSAFCLLLRQKLHSDSMERRAERMPVETRHAPAARPIGRGTQFEIPRDPGSDAGPDEGRRPIADAHSCEESGTLSTFRTFWSLSKEEIVRNMLSSRCQACLGRFEMASNLKTSRRCWGQAPSRGRQAGTPGRGAKHRCPMQGVPSGGCHVGCRVEVPHAEGAKQDLDIWEFGFGWKRPERAGCQMTSTFRTSRLLSMGKTVRNVLGDRRVLMADLGC